MHREYACMHQAQRWSVPRHTHARFLTSQGTFAMNVPGGSVTSTTLSPLSQQMSPDVSPVVSSIVKPLQRLTNSEPPPATRPFMKMPGRPLMLPLPSTHSSLVGSKHLPPICAQDFAARGRVAQKHRRRYQKQAQRVSGQGDSQRRQRLASGWICVHTTREARAPAYPRTRNPTLGAS